jgi:thiosulfate dehydrogenase (quinone) large subunit
METHEAHRQADVRDGLLGVRTQTWLAILVPARIIVGYHFLLVAWPKVVRGFPGSNLAEQLMENAPRIPIELHRQFIVGFVVPNVDVFAALITWGEVAIGLSLLTGCLVRLSTPFAAFQNLNIYLAIAIPSGSPQIPWNRTLIFMHLVFFATSAGRSFGVDGLLKRKFPGSPLF